MLATTLRRLVLLIHHLQGHFCLMSKEAQLLHQAHTGFAATDDSHMPASSFFPRRLSGRCAASNGWYGTD